MSIHVLFTFVTLVSVILELDFVMPPKRAAEATATDATASVEETYLKKTQLEHILLRPDTYIGSVESTTCPAWVLSFS